MKAAEKRLKMANVVITIIYMIILLVNFEKYINYIISSSIGFSEGTLRTIVLFVAMLITIIVYKVLSRILKVYKLDIEKWFVYFSYISSVLFTLVIITEFSEDFILNNRWLLILRAIIYTSIYLFFIFSRMRIKYPDTVSFNNFVFASIVTMLFTTLLSIIWIFI